MNSNTILTTLFDLQTGSALWIFVFYERAHKSGTQFSRSGGLRTLESFRQSRFLWFLGCHESTEKTLMSSSFFLFVSAFPEWLICVFILIVVGLLEILKLVVILPSTFNFFYKSTGKLFVVVILFNINSMKLVHCLRTQNSNLTLTRVEELMCHIFSDSKSYSSNLSVFLNSCEFA